jgi:hypothetical protein
LSRGVLNFGIVNFNIERCTFGWDLWMFGGYVYLCVVLCVCVVFIVVLYGGCGQNALFCGVMWLWLLVGWNFDWVLWVECLGCYVVLLWDVGGTV